MHPYSGLAFAAAGVDGHVMPLPSAWALLVAAIQSRVARALGRRAVIARAHTYGQPNSAATTMKQTFSKETLSMPM